MARSSSVYQSSQRHLLGFLSICFLRGEVVSLTEPPHCGTRVSPFFWVIIFDLSSMGGPTSSNAIASLALWIL